MKLNIKLLQILIFLILNIVLIGTLNLKSSMTLLKKNLVKNSKVDLVNLNQSTTLPESPELLKEGEVCYRSTPDFNGEEKKCEQNLQCRFKDPSANNPPGTVKYCLPESKVAKAMQPELLKDGEVCYRSTPDFNGEEKKCEQNLQCRFKDPSANNPPGSVKYCLNVFVAPPEKELA